MRSYFTTQETTSNHLRWNVMEDRMRKRKYIYVYGWVTLLCSKIDRVGFCCRPEAESKGPGHGCRKWEMGEGGDLGVVLTVSSAPHFRPGQNPDIFTPHFCLPRLLTLTSGSGCTVDFSCFGLASLHFPFPLTTVM